MSDLPATPKKSAGRKATITREDIIDAALRLVGPNRSISTLSLREITREAGIAPNSFYRHFKSTEDLAICIIELAGSTLRSLIGEARFKAQELNKGIVRMSVETYMEQLYSDGHYLSILMREGIVGSDSFKKAVRTELEYFQQELTEDLIAFAARTNMRPYKPELIAKGITRLVFAMGADALDKDPSEHPEMVDQMVTMIKMLISGSYQLKE